MERELVFKLPDSNTPGYLKRHFEVTEILSAPMSLNLIDKVVNFLLPYVLEPTDKTEITELIKGFSQQELIRVLLSVVGGKKTVSDPKGEKSEEGGNQE